jgi:uncharacterized membrane protein YoaK (UPF0700 family)
MRVNVTEAILYVSRLSFFVSEHTGNGIRNAVELFKWHILLLLLLNKYTLMFWFSNNNNKNTVFCSCLCVLLSSTRLEIILNVKA